MGALPFLHTATVKNQQGDTLATDVPISVWPAARGMVSATGMTYDHEGEAPLGALSVLDGGNVRLTVLGTEYVVVDREPQQFVPHVALMLRRSTSRG